MVQFKATGCVGDGGSEVGDGIAVGAVVQAIKKSQPNVVRQTSARGYFGIVNSVSFLFCRNR